MVDSLIGRYPQDIATFKARSPSHHTEQLHAACIFFQGLEDQVVPPNQAEMMVEVLREKGLPVAYVPFEGEQHGFRQAKNIKRSLELEYFFYANVFGFSPSDAIEPITIENLTA
jgi:dipeptidyl aminopeptidase/acylaminoacyl peptidase